MFETSPLFLIPICVLDNGGHSPSLLPAAVPDGEEAGRGRQGEREGAETSLNVSMSNRTFGVLSFRVYLSTAREVTPSGSMQEESLPVKTLFELLIVQSLGQIGGSQGGRLIQTVETETTILTSCTRTPVRTDNCHKETDERRTGELFVASRPNFINTMQNEQIGMKMKSNRLRSSTLFGTAAFAR